MYILAIETTGPCGSAAVIDGEGKICERVSAEKMNHLKDLVPMIDNIVTSLSIAKSDITAVAASIGPGSFTGIRIGVATARALSQALEIPAVAVPTLDAFKLKCRDGALTVPIFNARRSQVYGGIYESCGADVLKSGPYMLEEVLVKIKEQLAGDSKTESGAPLDEVDFYGDGIDAYGSDLERFTAEIAEQFPTVRICAAPLEERYQRAAMTAQCALKKYRLGEVLSYEELLPDYMRATEAETKLKDGSLQREREKKMARFKAR